MRTTATRLPPLLCLLLLAGCGGGVTLEIPISGASTAAIAFSGGIPQHAENDDIRVEKALLDVDGKAKHANYDFVIREKNKSDRPASIRIEDVTDDAAVTMVEDSHPELRDGLWTWTGPAITPDETNAKWLFELENSIRVYRITIRTARGRTWVLYEGASYPGYAKTYYRQRLGLETQPAAAH